MRHLIETLETRSHFSASATDMAAPLPTTELSAKELRAQTRADAKAAKSEAQAAKLAAKLAKNNASNENDEYNLSAAQVSQLLAQAAAYMRDGQAAVIVDREGIVLGIYRTPAASQETVAAATSRARTGGYFQSTGEAFTTRTARFIIQNHFPFPIRNTPGGPLYGVQFSSLAGTDILAENQTSADAPNLTTTLSADPGGLPLYIDGIPAGGIGIAGDGNNVAPIESLQFPGQKIFNGVEEKDFDEAVAFAAVKGLAAPKEIRINAEAPKKIQATNVILGNTGLRFPYLATKPAKPLHDFVPLTSIPSSRGVTQVTPTASQPNPYPKVDASVYGVGGEYKNTTVPGFGIVPSNDVNSATGTLFDDDQKLTVDDVNTIIGNAVKTALDVRAGIRLPVGKHAVVHIAVVDRDGTVLGVFRMNDGTNFSFDVAVQKARTAAFFSDDDHAFSTRSIGFMSQKFFPSGIDGGSQGPLYLLQDVISDESDLGTGPLANGITIFPGGIPLYKNGVFVGAIGISGDGVEEDDEIAFGGSEGYRPRKGIRSDELGRTEIRDFIVAKVTQIAVMKNLTNDLLGRPINTNFIENADRLLSNAFNDFSLPYVKFKRHSRLSD